MRIINTYREPVDPEKILTESEIIGLCCEKVPVDPCSEVGKVGTYDGVDEKHRKFDEKEELAKAQAAAKDSNSGKRIISVRVEAVGPPTGTPCGKLHESWEGQNNCCDGVVPLAWDHDITPEILPHGSSILIAWTGSDGREVEVTTSSNGTYFSDGRKTAIGHGTSIELFSGETFCGATAVTVTDNCSVATVVIRSDLGQWLNRGPICGLRGVVGQLVSGLTYEAVSGKYKMVETVQSAYWMVQGLGCDTSGLLTPAPGYENTCHSGDCDAWYCEKVAAARPADAVMDVCLHYDVAAIVASAGVIHGTLPDGVVVQDCSQTAYSCHWTNGQSGGGAKPANCGYYLKSTNRTLYEWSC